MALAEVLDSRSSGSRDRRRRRGAGTTGWTALALVIAAIVSIPILVVLAYAFLPATEVWGHLVSTVLGRYITNTLWILLGVAALTLVMGAGTAWLVSMCAFPGRRVFEWALLLPLAMPAYAIAFTYGGMLDFAGPVQSGLRELFGWGAGDYWFPDVRSLAGVILLMGLVLYPYVYLLARTAFLEQSVCVLEVGRTLGQGPWRTFRRIALPLARPAIAAGMALGLMEALSEFGAMQYLAVDTFTTGIFRTWQNLGDLAAAAQLAAVLMLFIFALLAIERVSRGRAAYHHTTTKYRPLPRYPLTGWHGVGALAACLAPIALGFLVPAGQLALWSVDTAPKIIDARFFREAANTVGISAVAAILAVGIALLLAYAVRIAPGRLAKIGARIASLGYAIPGPVVAVGVMIPFAWTDNAVDRWTRATFDVSTGLVLSGTLFAVLFAYVVRFLAISLNTVESGLGKITPNMDRAARSLGARPGATLRRVHAPMVRGSLLAAGLLVFVHAMKELPATWILRPFDFNTLAVRAFELASDERLADAAPAALAIVLAGLVPVLLLSKALTRSRPGEGQESRKARPGESQASKKARPWS